MHQQATSVVPFIACGSPEHPVTLHVVDKTSGAPLAAVELRLGVFRTATNDAGNACVVLPRGTYDVGCWKYGYEMASKTVVIAADAIIHVEMTAAREPEQPYWM
jgi:hypothetical protein